MRDRRSAVPRTMNASDVNVLPYIGDRSGVELARREVREVLERIVKRGSPIAANRISRLSARC